MAGTKHAQAFSLENEETAAFLKPQGEQPNPLHAMRDRLAQAKISPDIRPADLPSRKKLEDDGAAVAGAQSEAKIGAGPAEAPVEARAPVIEPATPLPTPPSPTPQVIADEASVQIPEKVVQQNKGGRPLQGRERKVERTVSMHKPLDKLLERLSNHEGLRLDRNVSTASVAVHLMMYALSHVKDNAVFPGEDGNGLEISLDPEAKGLVAKALRELIELDDSEETR